jgi:DNA-binding transcriptional LysR family regulator
MNDLDDSSPLPRLDLNLLRVFDAVYRERNLTRAATTLSLSQSAISHAIGRLRFQLDDTLFVRAGFGVTPSPLAQRLAPVVQEMLAALSRALTQEKAFDPARDLRRVVIAMREEMEPQMLPALAMRLRQAAPTIEIASVRLDRNDLAAELAARRIDLAIDVARPAGVELLHAPLFEDRFCVVASRRRRLDLPRYLEAEHVTVSSRRSGPTMEEFLLRGRGVQRRVALRCQSYDAACRIVAESELLLTMPRNSTRLVERMEGLFVLPPPLELPAVEMHLYWHRQTDGDPAQRWLQQQLQTIAKSKRHRRAHPPSRLHPLSSSTLPEPTQAGRRRPSY